MEKVGNFLLTNAWEPWRNDRSQTFNFQDNCKNVFFLTLNLQYFVENEYPIYFINVSLDFGVNIH